MLEQAEVDRWRRLTRAMIRQATASQGTDPERGAPDPEAFAQVLAVLAEAQQLLPGACAELRAQGFSWSDIAAPLGVTRSAAQQRFRVRDDELVDQRHR